MNKKDIEGRIGEFALKSLVRRLERKSAVEVEASGLKIGRLLARLSKKRFGRAVENLRMALPDLPDPEAVAMRVFENFGRMGADFMTLHKRSPEEIIASVDFPELGKVDEALALGKGVIMITGHFGNWERMAACLSYKGYKLSVVARDADQKGVTGIMNGIRSHSGTQVIPRGNAARPMLECLRRNELIGILPDQNSNEAFLPFFGKLAGTVLGPGVLHERTGAPVLGLFCRRIGPAKFAVQVKGPLTRPHTSVRGEATMLAIHEALEEVIRETPDQWLWFHDRWRNARRKGLL